MSKPEENQRNMRRGRISQSIKLATGIQKEEAAIEETKIHLKSSILF